VRKLRVPPASWGGGGVLLTALTGQTGLDEARSQMLPRWREPHRCTTRARSSSTSP